MSRHVVASALLQIVTAVQRARLVAGVTGEGLFVFHHKSDVKWGAPSALLVSRIGDHASVADTCSSGLLSCFMLPYQEVAWASHLKPSQNSG